jgi:hypothetical protein
MVTPTNTHMMPRIQDSAVTQDAASDWLVGSRASELVVEYGRYWLPAICALPSPLFNMLIINFIPVPPIPAFRWIHEPSRFACGCPYPDSRSKQLK